MAGHGREDPDAVLRWGHPLHYQTQQTGGKMAGLCWADWERNSMGVVITKTTSLSGNSMGGALSFWP